MSTGKYYDPKLLEAVENLYSRIQKYRIILAISGEQGGLLQFFPIEVFDFKDTRKDWLGKKLLFSVNYIQLISELTSSISNLFLPKKISTVLKKFEVSFLDTEISEEEQSNRIITFVPEYVGLDPDKTCGIPNGKELLLKEYFKLWEELITEIKDWYKKEAIGNSKIDLNL